MTLQQLSALDASFLYLENERVANHIGGLYIYDQSTVPGGVLGFKEILKYMESRLQLAPRFRQKVANVPLNLDHPYWVDDERFDLEYHIRHVALPKPGDWRQLNILVSRIMDRPLDLNRPLWTLHIIEGLDNVDGVPPGSFAMVSRMHHAAIDGTSGMAMNMALHELEPQKGAKPGDDWKAAAAPNPLELLLRAQVNNIAQPLRFMRVLAESMPASMRVLAGLQEENFRMPTAIGEVPRTRFAGAISGHRMIDGVSFPLADLKAIKDAVPGATVNDVVLTIGGGALRKYLEDKNELPDKPLITLAPISIRGQDNRAGGTGAMAANPGNQVAGMLASLGTDVKAPLARFEAVHASTVNSKELTNAIGAKLMTDYSQFIPAATTGLAARLYSSMGLASRMQPLFNTVMTNVPGPQMPLYFAGAKMVSQYGLGIVQDGLGLFHSIVSYDGNLTVCAVSDREMMPDPDVYMDAYRESFAQLKAATAPKPKPAPRRKPAAESKPTANAATKAGSKASTAKKPAPKKAPAKKAAAKASANTKAATA